jgi:hypothetical protein
VTPAAAKGQYDCEGLAFSASAPRTLLIVETHRRHIREHHRLQATDIDSNLHRCCYAQDIDFVDLRVISSRSRIRNVDDDVPEMSLALGLVIGLSS